MFWVIIYVDMRRLKLALFIGGIGLIIALLHVLAINFFLYWDIFWFDMFMHFLGGAWVALLGFWLLAFFNRVEEFTIKNVIWVSIFFTLGIGILWEVFEAGAGVSFIGQDMWGDAISDLLLDVVGGLVAGFYVYKGYKRSKQKTS